MIEDRGAAFLFLLLCVVEYTVISFHFVWISIESVMKKMSFFYIFFYASDVFAKMGV